MTAPTDAAAPVGDIYTDIYPKPARMTLRLNEDGWREHLARKGIASDSLLGSMLGWTPSSIWRIRKGENSPSGDFVAQALTALDPATFDELFDIVPRAAVAKSDEQQTDAA